MATWLIKMITSTESLIAMEKAILDRYGKEYTGSELAAFVAERTKKYFLQEVVRFIRDRENLTRGEIANAIESYFFEQ
jgi:hypothetical protein